MGAVIAVVIIIVVVLWGIGSVSRSVNKVVGKSRCAFCKARLKKVGGGYAAFCRKCGREQPWAKK